MFLRHAQVNGLDSDGYDFQRSSRTAIRAIAPMTPVVSMPRRTQGHYDRPATLICSVISLVPFSVQWYREQQPLGNELYFSESADVKWSIADASSRSEGRYICNATNVAGWAHAETFLNVRGKISPQIVSLCFVKFIEFCKNHYKKVTEKLQKKMVEKIAFVDPPPTILRPANVSVLPGYDVTLTCVARSTVEHNMTWYRARDYDGLRNDSRVAFLRNGSLSIRYILRLPELL